MCHSVLHVCLNALVIVAVCFTAELSAAESLSDPNSIEPGFVPLCDGKTLAGWEGNLELWSVRDGVIVGDSKGITDNEFLATKKTYGNFELRLEFRLCDGKGNTGIQFRSRRVAGTKAVEGYQADIGEEYWGCLYDEHRRRKVLVHAPAKLHQVLKVEGWNTYVIRAEGNHVVLKINGLKTVDYREEDSTIARQGIIALQIHSGPPMQIEFRRVRIKDLR